MCGLVGVDSRVKASADRLKKFHFESHLGTGLVEEISVEEVERDGLEWGRDGVVRRTKEELERQGFYWKACHTTLLHLLSGA